MEQHTKRTHFSIIREFHLADFITLANAACGVGAVFLAMLYLQSGARAHFYAAAAMAACPCLRVSPHDEFADVKPGHNRLACARVIRKDKAQGLAWKQGFIDAYDLMPERLHI